MVFIPIVTQSHKLRIEFTIGCFEIWATLRRNKVGIFPFHINWKVFQVRLYHRTRHLMASASVSCLNDRPTIRKFMFWWRFSSAFLSSCWNYIKRTVLKPSSAGPEKTFAGNVCFFDYTSLYRLRELYDVENERLREKRSGHDLYKGRLLFVNVFLSYLVFRLAERVPVSL
jgi:hypothetical protein